MIVPEHINFNMCAAQDFVQLTFEIRNARYVSIMPCALWIYTDYADYTIIASILYIIFSELVTPFCVDCKDPFVIEPNEGVLEPFTTQTLTATFKPKVCSHCIFPPLL